MTNNKIKVKKVKKTRTKTQKMILVSSILMLIVLSFPIIFQLTSAIFSYLQG